MAAIWIMVTHMKCILSIDGGGVRGLIPAMVLQHIETTTGFATAQLFDLVGGTSTGGLLALGLAKDAGDGRPQYSAHDLLGMYLNHGADIYNQEMKLKLTSVYGLFDELYSHKTLEAVLMQYFADATMGQCLTHTLISSYDIEQRTPFMLKSWRPSCQPILMRQAARATSAAPTYFEPTQIEIDTHIHALVDGGVCANSPATTIYAEALRLFPEETEFFMLSLGTGKITTPILFHDARHWGKLQWLGPLLASMLGSIGDVVDYQMRQFLGAHYVRVQTTIHDASQDNASETNLHSLQQAAAHMLAEQQDCLHAVCHLLCQHQAQR